MRVFSLLFALIALVVLLQFLLYITRGPVDWRVAVLILAGFLFSLAPALYLLKPFERPQSRGKDKKDGHQDHPKA